MAYLLVNNEPEFLKLKARDDEIKNLKDPAERHDYENIFRNHLKLMKNIKRRCMKV